MTAKDPATNADTYALNVLLFTSRKTSGPEALSYRRRTRGLTSIGGGSGHERLQIVHHALDDGRASLAALTGALWASPAGATCFLLAKHQSPPPLAQVLEHDVEAKQLRDRLAEDDSRRDTPMAAKSAGSPSSRSSWPKTTCKPRLSSCPGTTAASCSRSD